METLCNGPRSVCKEVLYCTDEFRHHHPPLPQQRQYGSGNCHRFPTTPNTPTSCIHQQHRALYIGHRHATLGRQSTTRIHRSAPRMHPPSTPMPASSAIPCTTRTPNPKVCIHHQYTSHFIGFYMQPPPRATFHPPLLTHQYAYTNNIAPFPPAQTCTTGTPSTHSQPFPAPKMHPPPTPLPAPPATTCTIRTPNLTACIHHHHTTHFIGINMQPTNREQRTRVFAQRKYQPSLLLPQPYAFDWESLYLPSAPCL